MSEKEIMHVGVLGMRWGKRRATQNANLERHGVAQPKNNLSKYKSLNDLRKAGARKALDKDIADFDKHGMKEHADALRKNLAKMDAPKREFKAESLTKQMDGRKVNKLFGKRNIDAAKKKVADYLLTPAISKVKWTDMTKQEKNKTLVESSLLTIGAVALFAIGQYYGK